MSTPTALRFKRSMFVGSYQRVQVNPKVLGADFEDLDFTVSGGDGTTVSPSRDETFDPRKPSIMLLAGDEPGGQKLVVTQRSTGTELAVAKFRVSTEWSDPTMSPTRWIGGAIDLGGPMATWGGGNGTGPQNTPATPLTGTRKIVVAIVDTSGARWPTTGTAIADAQQLWNDNLVNGTIGADGVTRSVAQYFREVSYFDGTNGVDIVGEVLTDVVHLPNAWGSYFQTDSQGRWQAVNTFCRTVMTTAGVAKFDGANMVVCVTRDGGGTPTKVAWPYGGYDANATAGGVTVSARGVSMPVTWGDGSSLDQGSGRTIHETLTHELGHTIGFPDAYQPVVAGRNVGSTSTGVSWDPMSWEDPWPHFTAAHRLMLGWVKPPWIKTFNFASLGQLVDEEVVLAPIEHGPPFPNAFSAIEVRVGDGHNYYFEYRRGEGGEIGDQQLSPNSRVVGIEVRPADATRPDILLLAKHTDDDGAVLAQGQKYHEIDSTSPTFPVDFRCEVIEITPAFARVRIRYDVVGKPDPTIRPWPRDAAHAWQSPDIEVSNAKSAANPAFANVPWNGHPNTVTAKIRNGGTLNATGVVAKFFWKDYTIGGAPETFIASDTRTIAPGAIVPFTVTWTPQAPTNPSHPQHYCVIVRIDPYSAPTVPPVPELTSANNEAQSNYARFISASASPPSRQVSEVSVSNPFTEPTRFFLVGGQTRSTYRTYFEHSALTLAPGEIRPITVMFEYAPDTLPKGQKPDFREVAENHISIVGLIEDPLDPLLHGPQVVTGVSAEVAYGRATRFGKELRHDGPVVAGDVVTVDDGRPVRGGQVIVVAIDKEERTEYITVEVSDQGEFKTDVPQETITVELHYVPSRGYGECTSDVLTLR